MLKKETLAITEVELFKGVLKWIDSECGRQGINIEEDKTARRRVLGDSVYEIRFLAMSQEDFAKYVSPTGMLTDTEIVSIFQKFNGLDVAGLKWKHGKRQPCIRSFSRFDPADKKLELYYCSDRPEVLTLTVNKAVVFHGVRLFGFRGNQYKVKFTIKSETQTGTYTSQQDNDGVWGFDVMLSKPISLLPNENFRINALIKGPICERGQNGKSSVKLDDIVVTFENAPSGLDSNVQQTKSFYKIFLSEL